MLDNEDSINPANHRIIKGATVYDIAGDKVGTLDAYDPDAGYLDVRKGWLFHKDVFVPVGAIDTTDADGIYLRLTKDELADPRFDVPPTSGSAATETTEASTLGTFAEEDQDARPAAPEDGS